MNKRVSIIWEDSRQLPGWRHLDEIDEDVCVCHSIGWLIKESDTAFFLTSTTADDEKQIEQVVIIPKSCVKEMCEINTHSNEENDVEKKAESFAEA